MLVDIRARHGRIKPGLEDRLMRRLHFALARFGGRIRRISAYLEDTNGPRGGVDQRCRIEVTLVPSGSVMAEATDAEVVSALGRAAERAARRVRDALERKRTMRTRTGGPPGEDGASSQAV